MSFFPQRARSILAGGDPNPTRTRLAQELRHNSPLFSCRFDPTGRFVFAGAQDNTIHRWELATSRKVALTGHRSWMRALAFLPAQRQLVSGGYDGRLIWWQADADAPTPLRTVEAHRGWVRAVAISPDGRLVASCGNDNLVKLWSADGAAVRELSGHASHVYNVAFHPDGRHLVSGDLRGVVKQWEVARGAEVRSLDAAVLHRYDTTFRADIGGVRSMAFSRDGSLLGCAGITDVTNAFAGIGRPVIVLFDWNTGVRRHLLRPAANFQGTMWGVDFHLSGFIAGVGGGSGGALWFWRPDQAQSFHTLALPNNARDLHLHPDGRRLAVAFFDGAVRIYDMAPV
ncbi:MAG TPA: WD40 repeat domain-containing protein [Gemmataceae bacterium]|nr:WD40 repeat domain-containing protein [Gemmataceae bacterium]